MLWYIDLCTCLVKDYDIYYGTKCFDIDRIYALSLTMFQWAPPMGIIRWYLWTLPVGVVRWCLWTLPVGVVRWYLWTLPVGVVRWYLWTLSVEIVRWYSVDPANGG